VILFLEKTAIQGNLTLDNSHDLFKGLKEEIILNYIFIIINCNDFWTYKIKGLCKK